ncbi:hypothetical protein [Streptomyces bobili]|uniref:hypothetical protein n=1 Tax=Streptomyces bobili TaxID=67280 RepID=UPI0038246969
MGGSQAGVVDAHHAVHGLDQGLVLGGQLLEAPGEALQPGEDGGMDRVAGRLQPGQGVSAVRSFETAVLGPVGLGGGDEDAPDLVQGGGAGLRCGSGGVGVDGVGLADAAPFRPVGPVDLDDTLPV